MEWKDNVKPQPLRWKHHQLAKVVVQLEWCRLHLEYHCIKQVLNYYP